MGGEHAENRLVMVVLCLVLQRESVPQAAILGLGVTLTAVRDALPYMESGVLVSLLPYWYADAGPISFYYANRTLLPAETRVFIDFIRETSRKARMVERFDGSLGPVSY